ncbi:MAG: ABC transporter ATP-binding protein [Thermoplasmata archaeon]
MSSAIEVHGLVKQYPSLKAVDGIDFSVATGQVFAFLGPNGAGKTTTVEILEGLRNRTAGDVSVLGLDPWTQGGKLHRQIGVIPQDFRFFDKITPKEAVVYYAALFGTHPDAMHLLERVRLEDKATAHFDTLSGGQKQKLGLALSLVNDPKLCFLDEPTTGLDPQARRVIWDVIRQLKVDGRGVFLTTHYLEEAELLADQVAIINHGKIIAAGTPTEIIQKYGTADRVRVIAPPALADYLRAHLSLPVSVDGSSIEVEIAQQADIQKVLAAIEASQIPWKSFTTRQDTLENVFIHLVGRMDEYEGTLKSETAP